MTTPVTYAPAKQFVGIANETVQGTPVAMTATTLVEAFKPKDDVRYLEDKALRGAMGNDAFAEIPGVKTSDLDISGPVFGDGLGYFLRNILGDLSITGAPDSVASSTLSSGTAVGATTCSVASGTGFVIGQKVQIGSGATAEVVVLSNVSGTTLTFTTTPLAFAHTSAQPAVSVTGPYANAFSLLNSGSGQPISHTLTHFLGPTATSGARQYPGACLSELGLKWNAESELFTWSGKATAYPSVALGSAPTSNPTTIQPIASWQMLTGIGGPASGGTLMKTVTEGELTIKRELMPYFTANGVQSPYIIQRGGLSVEGKLTFVAADESPLLYLLNNTQPQLQLIIGNGLAGTNLIQVQIDIQKAAVLTSEPDDGKAAVEYQTTFKGVFNTTNAGGSGSYSPVKVTVTNNQPGGTY